MFYFFVETLSFVFIMVFVAFFILAERKVLGYMQLRKGPNKVGFLGLLQSFADLMKLVIKFKSYHFQYRSVFSLFGTYLLVLISFIYSFIYGLFCIGFNSPYLLLVFLLITSLSSYSVLSVGWGSNNKYSLYGSLRSSFGAVSYEVSFMCFVLIAGGIYGYYSFYDTYLFSNYYNSLFLFLWPIYLIFILCSLCETNRIPFDFAESESDLVSGFYTEYCNVYFVCLFASEYLIVFIMCWLSSIFFFSGFLYYIGLTFTVFLFLWFRGTLPRIYYITFVSFYWSYLIVILSWFLCLIF
uniref:NADH-ubiquinone oxidoreductase chain 1 n=1 Tax=Paragyrodactylus variegatus TaxID=1415179 RepID=A0A076VCX3_9PLAT|nr:NADH dehydrogenase subunit 1 [Paragyrodactylus variegatus]AIK25764.1 NADH dehydrogenase subunit 1 [Paragyrodactylus variegatus]